MYVCNHACAQKIIDVAPNHSASSPTLANKSPIPFRPQGAATGDPTRTKDKLESRPFSIPRSWSVLLFSPELNAIKQ